MKLKLFLCIVCIILVSIWITSVYAATTTPSLVTKINSAFTKIQSYLKKISTPIAGVCITSGILIRKLSFGDEKKMVIGKRIITNSIVGYASIQLLDLIIKFIETIVK
ncbi:MAG: hypothetical protein ACI4ON_00710 [Clostridia bacterium]